MRSSPSARGIAGGRAGQLPAARPRAGPRRAQRDRCRVLPTRSRRPTCSTASVSMCPARWSCSSVASPARRACRTFCVPGSPSTHAPRSCSSPAPPTRPSSPPRPTPPSPSCAPVVTPCSSSRRCCRARRSVRRSPTPPCSSAHRSTSRWGSSTSRRWPRGPPSSPATSAASRRSSTTASPGCSCTTTPATPRRSRPVSPRRSTSSSAIPSERRRWGRPGVSGPSTDFGWDVAARRTLEIYESLVALGTSAS